MLRLLCGPRHCPSGTGFSLRFGPFLFLCLCSIGHIVQTTPRSLQVLLRVAKIGCVSSASGEELRMARAGTAQARGVSSGEPYLCGALLLELIHVSQLPWDQGVPCPLGSDMGTPGTPRSLHWTDLAFPFSLSWSFQCWCAVAVGGELPVCCSWVPTPREQLAITALPRDKTIWTCHQPCRTWGAAMLQPQTWLTQGMPQLLFDKAVEVWQRYLCSPKAGRDTGGVMGAQCISKSVFPDLLPHCPC